MPPKLQVKNFKLEFSNDPHLSQKKPKNQKTKKHVHMQVCTAKNRQTQEGHKDIKKEQITLKQLNRY